MTAKTYLAYDPDIEDIRICAICLGDVERSRYNEHMQHIHGYETLHINPEDVLPSAEMHFPNDQYLNWKLNESKA